jgi:hypothetical protein
MTPIHASLAAGRWKELTLSEQLGNVGSEISRALSAQRQGNTKREQEALLRLLELLDLTIADPKHRGARLRELCRMREVLCDYFCGENTYGSTPKQLNRDFAVFSVLARQDH